MGNGNPTRKYLRTQCTKSKIWIYSHRNSILWWALGFYFACTIGYMWAVVSHILLGNPLAETIKTFFLMVRLLTAIGCSYLTLRHMVSAFWGSYVKWLLLCVVLAFEMSLLMHEGQVSILLDFCAEIVSTKIEQCWLATAFWGKWLISAVPHFLAAYILGMVCGMHSFPWGNGSTDLKSYHSAELKARVVRGFIYSIAVGILVFSYSSTAFASSRVCMANAVALTIPLYVASIQSIWRLNFRRWPNHIISLANILVYLALLDLFCEMKDPNSAILGFINVATREEVLDRLNLVPSYVQSAIILAPIIAVLKDGLTNMFSGLSSINAADLPQYRRRTRRRLLTHWHYNKNRIAFTLENSSILLIFTVGVYYLVAISLALAYPVIKLDNQGNEILQLSFSARLMIVAMVAALTAVVSFWNVSDARLIRSEYYYLIYQGPRMAVKDIRCSSPKWNDFCQVLVNLYSSASGLESEDRGYHDMPEMLKRLRSSFEGENRCVSLKFVADILKGKGDINATLRREAGYTTDSTNLPIKSDKVQLAQDIQFARHLLALTKSDIPQVTNATESPIYYANPMMFIRYMTESFFGSDAHEWIQHFNAVNIDAQEGIELLKMDSILNILQQEHSDECGLRWLGCYCNPINATSVGSHPLRNRLELLLRYPFVVLNCYIARWGKPSNEMSFLRYFRTYYWKLFEDELYVNDPAMLPCIVESSLNFFATTSVDMSVLRVITTEMNAQPKKIRADLTNAQKDRIYAVNMPRTQAWNEHWSNLWRLMQFYKDITEEDISDLFRLTYCIFCPQ